MTDMDGAEGGLGDDVDDEAKWFDEGGGMLVSWRGPLELLLELVAAKVSGVPGGEGMAVEEKRI